MHADHEPMQAPGAQRRADEAVFQMTATHLARTMETTRARERQRVAALIRDRADLLLGQGKVEHAAELDTLVEEVLSVPVEVNTVRATTAAPALRDDEGDGLPPVRHHDDFAEGVGMVRNLGARGRLNL